MNRRKDKSMIKLYKDLMITRRDLIDLKESITQTINSIKVSDQRIKMIELERKGQRNIQQPFKTHHPQPPSSFHLKLRARCEYCALPFPNNEALQQHVNEKHQICKKCRQEIKGTREDHLLFTCGQSTTECEYCNILVKLRDLDTHVKVCSFRVCYKCKKEIYVKAYSFHLQECKRSKNLIPPCKQFYKPKPANRSLVVPCCLVIDP